MFYRSLVLSIIALTLSACNISGSGQKGPFKQDSIVTMTPLDNQSLPINSRTITSKIWSKQGNYSVSNIKWNGWTELKVSGKYFDEFAGVVSDSAITLDAITKKDRRFDVANVHLFSHFAAARIRQRVTDGENRANAWKNTQTEMKALFGLERVSNNYHKGVEQLSLTRGSGIFKNDNANLLLFTGSFLAANGNETILNTLTQDFANDGQFNGAGQEMFNAIAFMGATDGLLSTLSNNLKSYGVYNPPNISHMPELPIWVNSDTGGDLIPPVITLNGNNPEEVAAGETYVDAGATALDDVDGSVDAVVINESDSFDTTVVGSTHIVTYEATDDAGNTATATRTVTVVSGPDNTPPVITITDGDAITVEAGSVYSDKGATALDSVDGVVPAVAIDNSDSVDTSVLGDHLVIYKATDGSDNESTATRTVTVKDSVKPVIVSNGNSVLVVQKGSVYVDAGATASDTFDGDLTSQISVVNPVNTAAPATYKVTYDVADSSGNVATQVERTVRVNAPPSASAGSDVFVELGNPVTLNGVGTDTDGTGVVTYQWKKGSQNLSATASYSFTPESIGTEVFTLTVTDSDGATSSDSVSVEVTLPPAYEIVLSSEVIEIPRNSNADIQQVLLANASIRDGHGNSIEAEPAVNITGVDIAILGEYEAIFSFIDPYNRTINKTMMVKVVNTAPEANEQAISTNEDTAKSIVLTGSDSNSDTLTYSITTQPQHGALTGDAPNVTYTPAENYHGEDSFSFTVDDGSGTANATATATIVIDVIDTNDAPTANAGDDLSSVRRGETITLSGAGDDTDGEITSYRWTGVGIDSNHEYATTASFDLDTSNLIVGDIVLRLTVTDNDGETGFDDIKITILPALTEPAEMTFLFESPLTINTGVYADRVAFYDYLKTQIVILDQEGNALNDESYSFDFEGYSGPVGTDIDEWENFDPTVAGIGQVNITYLNQYGDGLDDVVDVVIQQDIREVSFVIGTVRNTSGERLDDVVVEFFDATGDVVSVDGISSELTSGGELILPPLPADTNFTLKFTRDDLATQVLPIKTPAVGEQLNLDITLTPRGVSQNVVFSDTPLVGESGAKVTLSSTTSFVDQNGNVVPNNGITVTITPVDVSTPVGVAAFPGDFSGVPEGGVEPAPIMSYGTVEYVFRDSSGNELQLADGQNVSIEIPLYIPAHQDGSIIVAGETIPLWSLNEETGIWTQEGVGTVVESSASPTGFALQATVSHFTWWNADAVMNRAYAIVTVTAPENGMALIKIRTTGDIGGWGSGSVSTLISVGDSTGSLPIPSNSEVCFWAEVSFTSGNNATTAESCVTATENMTENISLEILGGTLSLKASPSVNISTYINVAPALVKIQPITSESSVSYEIESGSLPIGVSLVIDDATTATITGVPSEAGVFNPVIKATDSDGDISTLELIYTVTDGLAPPDLQAGFINYYDGTFSPYESQMPSRPIRTYDFSDGDTGKIDVNPANKGGYVDSWSIEVDPDQMVTMAEIVINDSGYFFLGAGSVSISEFDISIDSNTGIVTVVWPMSFIQGVNYRIDFDSLKATITATNASGSSSRELGVVKTNGNPAKPTDHGEGVDCESLSYEDVDREIDLLNIELDDLYEQKEFLTDEMGRDESDPEVQDLVVQITEIETRISQLDDCFAQFE